MPADRSRSLFPSLLASLTLPLAGLAQCPNTWQALPGCPGVNSWVAGLAAYDPDGAGPLPTHVVVAGAFQKAGLAATSGLALWNPATSTFSDLPVPTLLPGSDGFVAVAVRGTELLVAAYDQRTNRSRLASFDGTTWTTLGGIFQGSVRALHPRGNGEILIGGDFTSSGGTPLPGYAVWNGTSWAPDAGLSGFVQAIDELPNGDLLVAGSTNLGGIARRIGTTWSAVGSNAPSLVSDVCSLPSGEIVATADNIVRRFNGAQWIPMALPSSMVTHSLARLMPTSTGTLLVGGWWQTLAGQIAHVATLDVSTGQWAMVAPSESGEIHEDAGAVSAMLELPNGDLILGGGFTKSGGLNVANVARFDGLASHALADGAPLACSRAVALDGDAFVVGGSFRSFGNLPARGVAHWNGTAWGPLGTGIDGVVYDLARLPDGSVIVAGDFQNAGGVPAHGLARWDGSTWSAFGGLTAGVVRRLLPLANGDLLIGGEFASIGGVLCDGLARWNGTSFASIPGFLGTLSSVRHLGEFPNGDLIVADNSTIYRQWFGSWVPFSSTVWVPGLSPSDTIDRLVVRRDGSVAIAAFASPWYVPRLHLFSPNGSHQAIAVNGGISELHELPDGDLLVTGSFLSIGGVTANGAARLGTSQTLVLSAAPFDGRGVIRVVPLANGDLLGVGFITSLDGVPAFGVAKLAPGCRPTATSFGAGCSGSLGLNELRAKSLPWLGATFSMQATGLPVNSVALAFFGLQPLSIPLPLVTPLGIPGCQQLASIDLESLQATGSGVLDIDLPIPDAPPLIGLVLHAQVAALDFSPLGITSTNALQLVIGDR